MTHSTFTCCTYNTRLFGQVGMVGGRETKLNFRDVERAGEISQRLRELNRDRRINLVGLTEVWDDNLRVKIEESLQDLYPYRVKTPSAAGIGDPLQKVEEKWPRLAPFARRLLGRDKIAR